MKLSPLPSSSTNATTSNAANTPSGRALITVLPPGLNGIVSDNNFDDFSRTLNGYINEYDAILMRRKKIVTQQQYCDIAVFILVMMYFPSDDAKEITMPRVILTLLNTFVYMGLWCIAYFWIRKAIFEEENQQVIDEQNEIYRNVITACTDMSQRVTTTLPSSSPALDVTCSLGSKSCKDWIGSYNNMDYIKFTTTTAFENTGDNHTGAESERNLVVTTKEDDPASSK